MIFFPVTEMATLFAESRGLHHWGAERACARPLHELLMLLLPLATVQPNQCVSREMVLLCFPHSLDPHPPLHPNMSTAGGVTVRPSDVQQKQPRPAEDDECNKWCDLRHLESNVMYSPVGGNISPFSGNQAKVSVPLHT